MIHMISSSYGSQPEGPVLATFLPKSIWSTQKPDYNHYIKNILGFYKTATTGEFSNIGIWLMHVILFTGTNILEYVQVFLILSCICCAISSANLHVK